MVICGTVCSDCLHWSAGRGEHAGSDEESTLAFKIAPPPEAVPDSPEKILLELPRRKIPGVLLHQGQMMQKYVAQAQAAPDVALQLPTGSGKTLVGLLIGEWLRRKNQERVVFLCPTRQLVNQVVHQAEQQYGLSVHGFVGSKHSFDAAAKADYQATRQIAVTTYSALFNISPFFDTPDVIICDDAHAAENYIASMWSLRVQRTNPEHAALHAALAGLLKPFLDATDFGRLIGEIDENLVDASWVEKLPTPALATIAAEFVAIVDQYVGPIEDLRYTWRLLRDNLHACHVYMLSLIHIFHIRRSKSDQEGQGQKIGIPYGRTRWCPVTALDAWIIASGITQGAVFRPVDRHGRINDTRLSGEAVALVVRERVAAAGFEPAQYSGHSLRAGLATSAAQAGVPTWSIKAQTRHASEAMLARYIRSGELFTDNAAGAVL